MVGRAPTCTFCMLEKSHVSPEPLTQDGGAQLFVVPQVVSNTHFGADWNSPLVVAVS